MKSLIFQQFYCLKIKTKDLSTQELFEHDFQKWTNNSFGYYFPECTAKTTGTLNTIYWIKG